MTCTKNDYQFFKTYLRAMKSIKFLFSTKIKTKRFIVLKVLQLKVFKTI